MNRKIGIIMVVMALGMMCAGELMILSAQDSTGSATQQTQTPNDTPKGQTLTQTPPDPVTQQTQTPNDAIGENSSTGIRIFGIHFDPIIRLDMAFSILIALFLLVFGSKTRSKSPPELTSEEVSKPENASEVEEYIKAIERNPKATLVEKAIADAYMLQRGERIEEAIEKWRSLANILKGNDNDLASKALASVGYLCLKEDIGEDALSALNEAINLKPDFVEAYNNRGAAKNLLGRHQDAIADYDKAIRLKSDYAEAYRNRGTAKCLLGRYQDAIADYDEAIRLKPDYVKAYCHRGHVNRSLEKYEAAFADYDKAISLRPNYAEAYDYRGSVQFRIGHYRKAITDYSKVIQLIKSGEAEFYKNQENAISLILQKNTEFGEPEAYYNRGVARSKLGEFAEAIADYDKVIQLKPDYAEAYNNRGSAKIQLKQPNEALTDLNEAIRIKPDYAEAYNNRGGAKLLLRKANGALIDFDKAIRIKPDYAGAYNNRAKAKISLRSINEAKSDFQIALELAEQQENNDLKALAERHLQELNNPTPQTNET